ncbi:MAG: FN3 associated domain-containing protein, partial [Planctomycetaceae bacterium]
SQEAERGNPTWLYQRLLESNEFRVLLADHISKHLFRNGVLTPPRLTKLFDQRIAEIEPALFAEAARWGNSRKTYASLINGTAWKVEQHNSGVAKYESWFQEVARTRNDYIPRRTQIVIDQLFGRGLYPDLPEIAARVAVQAGNPKLELSAEEFTIYYTTDGQDPRLFGGTVNPASQKYDGPLKLAAGDQIVCRILADNEWGPVRSFRSSDFQTRP